MRYISRRQLIGSGAALMLPAFGFSARKFIPAYVGTYSSPQGPEGSKGNGQGIYLFQMDASSGTLTERAVFKDKSNPSWLALHPSGDYLYAANEISDFEGSQSGAVTAYRIDPNSWDLTRINVVGSEGAGPAHLSVHPSGKYVLVANYFGGTFAVFPVRPDGGLRPATFVQRDIGAIGPLRATSAPQGSFAVSGHDRPHAHMIQADPSGRFVLGSDLGMDLIRIWKFNADAGTLNPHTVVPVPPGDGPRHFVFHPNGRWMYSLQEEASTLILFNYDAAAGALTVKQQLSTLPPAFGGTDFTSEVRISPDGKFLYAANRLHDSIAFFSIGGLGTLTFAGEMWTRGDYPRSFTIDPTGSFLYSCNQRSDALTAFRVNRATGDLTFTGQYIPVGTPSIIVFLES